MEAAAPGRHGGGKGHRGKGRNTADNTGHHAREGAEVDISKVSRVTEADKKLSRGMERRPTLWANFIIRSTNGGQIQFEADTIV
jgi:hypothetical protein